MENHNDFNIGDMAEELAEVDYNRMSVRELLDGYTYQWQDDDTVEVALRKAWFTLRREWLQKATKDPEGIIKQYNDVMGL
jgi:hypothetical protein